MLLYLSPGSAATLRWKLQITVCISPSHSLLTPGQPVLPLTLQRQAPGGVASEVSGVTGPGTIPTGKAAMEPGPAAAEADALTTRPVRGVTSHGRIFSDNFTCCHTEVKVGNLMSWDVTVYSRLLLVLPSQLHF